MKRLIFVVFTSVLAVLVPVIASAQLAPTAFTYQGRLTDGGVPVTGSYDFQFQLIRYDEDDSMWLLVEELYVDDHSVVDGFFTAVLNFTVGPFSDEPLALKISVRPGDSSGAYDGLSPHQELNKVPQAQRALTATDVDGGVVDAAEVRIYGGEVIDWMGRWVGVGDTIPCAHCVGAGDIATNAVDADQLADEAVDTAAIESQAVTREKIEPGAINAGLVDPAGGIYVSKSQLYEVVEELTIPAAGIMGVTASCNDNNDLPITGGCSTPSVGSGISTRASFPMYWTDPENPAGWRCRMLNEISAPQSCNAHIICLDVP